MGKKHNRLLAQQQAAAAEAQAKQIATQRENAERETQLTEQYIGSDEQLSGGLQDQYGGYNEYSQRYSLDQGLAGTFGMAVAPRGKGSLLSRLGKAAQTPFYKQSLFGTDVAKESLRIIQGGQPTGTPGEFQGPDYRSSLEAASPSGGKQAMRIASKRYETPQAGASMIPQQIVQTVNAANELLDRAEEAARDGDLDTAQRLRAQAEGSLTANTPAGLTPEQWKAVFVHGTGDKDETMSKVAERLSSPLAMAVGQQVHEAREYGDVNSEGSRRFLSNLSEEALRTVAQQERAGLRSARETGLMAGGGRAFGQQAARQERVADMAAGQRANIYVKSRQFFEDFRQGFIRDTASFAQQFVQNQAGLRESYQNQISLLRTNVAQFGAGLAAEAKENLSNANAQASAKKDANKALAIGVLSTIAGAFTGGVGGVAVAAAGSAAAKKSGASNG